MSEALKNGQTVTFYSYKGGVGRSMALVNIACLAAKEKKKILLIDCDLEAPGLHQFFKAADDTKGFVDLVSDINSFTDDEANNNEEGYNTFMETRFYDYVDREVNPFAAVQASNANMPSETVAKNDLTDDSICIDLIKSGKFDDGYSKKLGAINWLTLYEKAPAFFRTFAAWLETKYDYIFIDARTGLADTSGICTMLMPQKLVMVFVLNKQNIDGVVDVARQAIDYRFDSNDCRRLDIYPLPSRIENSVNPYLQLWIDNYRGKFEKLFKDKYMLNDCRLHSYFDRCFIQYYAIHAYGENIPSLYESITSSNFITYNYNNFYTVVKKNIPAWEVLSLEEEQALINEANELFRQGLDLYYKAEYEKAKEKYEKVIELNPEYTDVYNEMGNIYFQYKKYNEALAFYNKSIALKPDYAIGLRNAGIVYNQLKENDKALEVLNKAIKLKPDYAEAYSDRGITKRRLKDYDSAIEDFNIAIKLKPEFADPYSNRGNIKFDLEKYNEALEDYSIAIKLKAGDAVFYQNRALAYSKLNDNDVALVNYTTAISLKPENASIYYDRGYVYERQKKYLEAEADYAAAVERDSGNADYYTELANVQYYQKKFEASLVNYTKAIEHAPGIAICFTNRGNVYFELKKYSEAADDFANALSLEPENVDALIGKGAAIYHLKQYQESLDLNMKAAEIDKQNAVPFINMAYAYRRLGNKEKAAEALKKAIELNPDDAFCYAISAENAGADGDDEKFYAEIEKALAIDFDIANEIENEKEYYTKYIDAARFGELLKKYSVTLSTAVK